MRKKLLKSHIKGLRTQNSQDQKTNATQHIIAKTLSIHRKESIMKTEQEKKNIGHS